MRPNLPLIATVVLLVSYGLGCGDGSPAAPSDAPPPSEPPSEPEIPPPGAVPPGPPPPPATDDPGTCDTEYTGTFDAIQQTIFARHGCTASACHGQAAAGDLDLRADVAHANLLEVTSTGSALPRIRAGDNDRSYLWLKLAAKTAPGTVSIAGSPMPVGGSALTEDELELIRLWIKAGAPATGTVDETQERIDGCVPPTEPIIIQPLAPPPADAGLQLVMPEYPLAAASEVELCFAQYYDLTDQVPASFQNPAGTHFRISESDLRQDPQSHHLILLGMYGEVDPASFGEFTCVGGERHGEVCEATDVAFCGDGACASPPLPSPGCTGLLGAGGNVQQILVAQQANEHQVLNDGVYAQIPLRGYWLWNSHAFNLTTKDTTMHARVNYIFAQDQRRPVLRLFNASRRISVPPFGEATVCSEQTFPLGTRVFNLISHTHKRGKRFWVELPDGELIYENFVYNDPLNQYYDPPLAFDAPDARDRTVEFCATFENGLSADGTPDPATVKRRSTTPPNTIGICSPIACTSGRIGAPCDGTDDHAACDTSPGSGDGECDACALSWGVTTEDEMLILLGAFYAE